MNFDWNPSRKEMVLTALGLPVPIEHSHLTKKAKINYLLITFLVLFFLSSVVDIVDPYQFAFSPSKSLRKNGLNWVSSFFVHVSLLHLLGNCYFLRIFGNLTEKSFHSAIYFLLIFISTVSGNFAVYWLEADRTEYYGGASGGIFGVMIFCLLSFPKQHYGIFFLGNWIKIPAQWLALFFTLLQLIGVGTGFYKGANRISYFSHIGGAIAGLLFWMFLKLKFKNIRFEKDLP